MEIVKQPDLQVFASEAKTGEIISFPDVLRGWGITLDQTNGFPPLEWMNDAFNRVDLNNLYLLQQGLPGWNSKIRYPISALIKYQDKIYLCTAENENSEPSANSDKWALYIRNASLTQKGITQLTSTLSDREDLSATPKMVDAIDKKAVSAQKSADVAKEKADLVGIQANNNTKEIGGKISIGDCGLASVSADTDIRDFKELPNVNATYTIAQVWTNGPLGDTTYSGIAETLVRRFRAGTEFIIRFHQNDDTYELRRKGGNWGEWQKLLTTENIFYDKNSFLKDKNNNINAIVSADLLQKLSDSTTEAVSAKVVNDVNRKAVEAEKIAVNADAKAVSAQKKADQVPNPKADNFVAGSNTTTYKLLTVDEVRALLNVPNATTIYQVPGKSTTATISQKGVTGIVFGLGTGEEVTLEKDVIYTNETTKPFFLLVITKAVANTGSGALPGLQISSDNKTWVDVVLRGAGTNTACIPILPNYKYKWVASVSYELAMRFS